MVSAEDSAQLRSFAIQILSDIGAFSAVTLFHGLFTLLFAFSTVIFIRRGLKTRASLVMFTVTVVTYAISTIYWAADLAIIAQLLKIAFIDTTDLETWSGRIEAARVHASMANSVSLCTSVIPPFIGDAVVIWRAWVLFPQQRWVMILPISMVLGTSATSVAYVSSFVARSFSGNINSRLFGASIILSMATNIVTTLFIAYKLWSHRKHVVKYLDISQRHSPAQKVLYLLVESGFLYCALQVVTLTLDSLPNAPVEGTSYAYAVQIFLCSYTVLSAMYPTIIIVLVNSQRSFVETCGFGEVSIAEADSQYRSATAGHLSFAAGHLIESTATTGDTLSAVEKGHKLDDRLTNIGVKRHTVSARF